MSSLSTVQPLLDDVVRGFNGSQTAVNDISSCMFIHDVSVCVCVCVCVCVHACMHVSLSLYCAHIIISLPPSLILTLTLPPSSYTSIRFKHFVETHCKQSCRVHYSGGQQDGHFFVFSDSSVIQFSLACGLCVGLMVLIVTATFHAGFFCNNKK